MLNKSIIEKVNKYIKETDFSGVISIRKDDQIIYQQASGYKDKPNQLPNNIETKFGLASGAKTYTAVSIMKLQEEGKLSVDDNLHKYLSNEFPNYHPDITLKHLLSHTSGIPDYLDEDAEEDLSHIPWSKLHKPKDYFTYFPQRDMDFKPGEKFKYNNGAYIILAHIIDQLTGNYHEYVHNILEEVGITETKYYRFDMLPPNTALGYITLDNNQYKTNIYELPIIGGGDGGIYSTEKDIYTFWIKLFNYEILSKESVEELIKIQANVSDDTNYGFGLWLRGKDNIQYVDMVGEDQGVSFISRYNLQTKEVLTILSNNSEDTWKALKIIEELPL